MHDVFFAQESQNMSLPLIHGGLAFSLEFFGGELCEDQFFEALECYSAGRLPIS